MAEKQGYHILPQLIVCPQTINTNFPRIRKKELLNAERNNPEKKVMMKKKQRNNDDEK